jgi:hypothetical protein
MNLFSSRIKSDEKIFFKKAWKNLYPAGFLWVDSRGFFVGGEDPGLFIGLATKRWK